MFNHLAVTSGPYFCKGSKAVGLTFYCSFVSINFTGMSERRVIGDPLCC